MSKNIPAGLQYLGTSGITSSCKNALIKLLNSGEKILEVKILTLEGEYSDSHALLLTFEFDNQIIIKDGFSSGYPGEGPKGYAYALNLLYKYTESFTELSVPKKVFKKIGTSSLTVSDIEIISQLESMNRNRLWDIIFHKDKEPEVFKDFPLTIPMSIIDDRLIDIALDFPNNSDNAILNAYRKLESIIRERTSLKHESSTRLLSKAFQGEESILDWHGIDGGEKTGRANLFSGAFMAYRNKRAHKEPSHKVEDDIREFLLINQLFILENQASRRIITNIKDKNA